MSTHINGDVDYSVDDIYGIVEKLHRIKKETVKSGGSEVPIPFWFLDKIIDLVWSAADISEDIEEPERIEHDEEYWEEFWAIDYDYLDSLDGCFTEEVSR